jgi:hypothetical protein
MPDNVQFLVVFFGFRQDFVAVFFQLFDLPFYFYFVNTVGHMVDAMVDAERFAESDKQVFLVELGISLDRLILDPFCDLPQLRDGLFFQFLVRICHKNTASCPLKWLTIESERQLTTMEAK